MAVCQSVDKKDSVHSRVRVDASLERRRSPMVASRPWWQERMKGMRQQMLQPPQTIHQTREGSSLLGVDALGKLADSHDPDTFINDLAGLEDFDGGNGVDLILLS